MKRSLLAAAIVGLSLGLSGVPYAKQPHALSLELLGTYVTGLEGLESSGETVALRKDRMYVTNAEDVSLDIVDVSDPATPVRLKRVDLKPYGGSANSVDVSSKGVVAVAVAAFVKTDPGKVVFLDEAGEIVTTATVGALPDMVVFTPQGDDLLVANEGEPDCYAVAPGDVCTDPEGSVSVVDVRPIRKGELRKTDSLQVDTIGFDGVAIPAGVRIFGPNASPAQDLEPEYITVSEDGKTAWVTLQENNAIAVLDLKRLRVTDIFPLGYKDHSPTGAGLDASDRDGPAINIRPWNNLLGMYQPDAIAYFKEKGRKLLITANEGDARDYDGFAEEERARAAGTNVADAADNARLGRLNVTLAPPGNDLDNLYAFGARSFSIWDAQTGEQVWDSGDQLEQITAAALPAFFNASNSDNALDSRSDNKGPEPEAVAVGKLKGRTYAFIGLERMGGVVVYDVSDPYAPTFEAYLVTRDFAVSPETTNSGPEVIRFIEAKDSPTGKPMLLVSNEISGTVNLVKLQAD